LNEKKKIGYQTTNNSKERGVDEIQEHLLGNRIFFSEFFFTNSTKLPEKSAIHPSEMIDELIQQLIGFESRWVEGNFGKGTKPKRIYSGKGSKKFDDIVMALIIGFLVHRECKIDKKYTLYKGMKEVDMFSN